jgi:glycosyltransferase involved in cell wall biosynthesis
MTTQKRDSYSFLLICQTYPPVIGGSELEAQRVCEALIERGHRVTVVCAGGEPMPAAKDWVDPKGVPVRIYAGRWKGSLKNMVFASRVACMLVSERKNYQFVYFLMQGLHLAVGLPVARLLGKPIVMKIAGSGEVARMNASVAGRAELKMLRRWAYRVMILNEGMRDEAIAWGFPAGQLLWMPNPVDIHRFAPVAGVEKLNLRARLGIPPDSFVVLFVGRLAPEKSLPFLLQAFSRVKRKHPSAILALVGDGPLREALVKQAESLGLTPSDIRFAGRVDPDDVCSWLKLSDAFALVSQSEGLPCSLIEAMSTGLPSVVTDIPANKQLVENEKEGLVVPVGDANAIAAAFEWLIQNPEPRSAMGRLARGKISETYSTDHVADQYEGLFRQLLSRN